MKPTLLISSLLIICYSLWAGIYNLNAAMSISAIIAFALLFFAHIDQIAKFKASTQGIEAETRAVVTRAEATLAQLQELAALMGKIQISLLVRQGRLGGYPEDEQEVFRKEILSVLEQIGVSQKRRDDSLSEVRRFAKFDYVNKILGGNQVPNGLSQDKIETWKKLRRCLHNPPNPEELKNFLEENKLLDESKGEWLKDYKHYISKLTHRRPEIWNRRRE